MICRGNNAAGRVTNANLWRLYAPIISCAPGTWIRFDDASHLFDALRLLLLCSEKHLSK